MQTKVTIRNLLDAKRLGQKFAVVACYDYTTARLVARTDVEAILVGDSAAQALLGFDNTLPVSMDIMVALTAAGRRAAANLCVIADMPFLSYQTGPKDAMLNAGRFVTEAGADIVKFEVSEAHLDTVKAVSDAGLSVMAHIGILPQTITRYGQLRAAGVTAEQAARLIWLAKEMVEAGAGSLLLEGVTREVANVVTNDVSVPVISCGSGPDCDGQVLIANDILGLTEGKTPKFTQFFGDLAQPIKDGFQAFSDAVHKGTFPDNAHSYHIQVDQLEQAIEYLKSHLQVDTDSFDNFQGR